MAKPLPPAPLAPEEEPNDEGLAKQRRAFISKPTWASMRDWFNLLQKLLKGVTNDGTTFTIPENLTVTGRLITNNTESWTLYTPTITAVSGTYTTASATGSYWRIGALCFVQVSIVITTVGTGTYPIFSLPFAARAGGASSPVWNGRENAATGFQLHGIDVSSTTVELFNYDNSNPAASGHQLVVSGVYITV